MTDEQIQAVCGEAKAQGLRSVVHAIGDKGARASVLAGCTAIEHGPFVTDETLDLMAGRGTFFDPNLLVLHNYLDNRSGFPPSTRRRSRRSRRGSRRWPTRSGGRARTR